MLSTFLSSEYRVPGPDPFLRQSEGSVPVLEMSSFSGEEQKANDQRLYSQMMGVGMDVSNT